MCYAAWNSVRDTERQTTSRHSVGDLYALGQYRELSTRALGTDSWRSAWSGRRYSVESCDVCERAALLNALLRSDAPDLCTMLQPTSRHRITPTVRPVRGQTENESTLKQLLTARTTSVMLYLIMQAKC